MRIHSIRLKMMIPILILAVLVLAAVGFMQVITKIEERAMDKQAKSYFEAIATVLNADRDIYQARLAQAEMLSNYGNRAEQQKVFDENAQQVFDRFQRFRNLLKDEPQLTAPFSNFESLYQTWLASSQSLNQMFTTNQSLVAQMESIDQDFYSLRNLLDVAEKELRAHAVSTDGAVVDHELMKRYLEAIAEVLNADRDLYQARLAQQKALTNIGDQAQNREEFERNALEAMGRVQSYMTLMSNEPAYVRPYARFNEIFAGWLKRSEALLDSKVLALSPEHQDILSQSDESFAAIRELLDKGGEAVRDHARLMEQQTSQEVASYQRLALIMVAVGFVIAFGIGYYMPKRITENVNSVSRRIKEISEGDGDLTARINSQSKDELGDLSREFDQFVTKLQGIMRIIQEKSAAVGDSTHELEKVADTVNQITPVLVDSSDSIVSAASEMSASNEQMANVASETSNESTNAADHIQQGRGVISSSHKSIDELVRNIDVTMNKAQDLENNSVSISSVLEVIRGIAEQTNLLALNAAIEAARAGEYGRGFAVVADEVRALATQTGESTNKIEEMISQLTHSVNEAFTSIKMSKENANQTVDSFNQVVEVFDALSRSMNNVRELSEQTALATQEQATVSNDINKNMIAMKDQTDGVDQASKQIHRQFSALSNLYRELDEQVSKFRV